ncbi:hypothetical protein BOP99_08770 [Campylobacter coli]|nr:hypothetical protein BOP99_08770 [Campylobacter coli]
MHYTSYEKNKITFFEIENTDENFLDTFMKIMQKSPFSVEIEKDKQIPSFLQKDAYTMQIIQNSDEVRILRMGGVCVWCYKDGKTTIIFDSIHPMCGYILENDFCNLYEQFLKGELNLEEEEEDGYEDDEDYYDFNEDYEELEEDDEEIELNYNRDDEEYLEDEEDSIKSNSSPFGSFALSTNFGVENLKVSLEDFQTLAEEMSKHYAYTQEELEKLGELRQRSKALKLRATLLEQKAFRRVCKLSLKEFQKLSAKELKAYQELMNKELIRVAKELLFCEYASSQKDKINVIAFHSALRPIANDSENIALREFYNRSITPTKDGKTHLNETKTYLINLVSAGAKVDRDLANLAMQSANSYTSLSYQRLQNKDKNISDEKALRQIQSLPRHKMLSSINLILQACVYQNYQRIDALSQIQDELKEPWSDEEYIEMFVIKHGKKSPKLLNYKQIDSSLSNKEQKEIAQNLLSKALSCNAKPMNSYKKAKENFNQDSKKDFSSPLKMTENTESTNTQDSKLSILFLHKQPTRSPSSLKEDEKEAIKKIFELKSVTEISQTHLNALDDLLDSLIKNLCGAYTTASHFLSKEQKQALLESRAFQWLFDDDVDESIFEYMYIHTLFYGSEAFSTRDSVNLCMLLDKPFQVTWENFILLLCTGVKIKKSYIKHIKNAKNIYKYMQLSLAQNYNENFSSFKDKAYTASSGEKIVLNNLRALQNTKDFLHSSNTYRLLKQVLKLLKELQGVEERTRHLKDYPSYIKFQECEFRAELFIYAFIDEKIEFLAYESLDKKAHIDERVAKIVQNLEIGSVHVDIEPIIEFLGLSPSIYLLNSRIDDTTFKLESTRFGLKINLRDFSNAKNCDEAKKAFLDFLERCNISQIIFAKTTEITNKLLGELGESRNIGRGIGIIAGEKIDDMPYNIVGFKFYNTYRDDVALIRIKSDEALEFLIGILQEQDKKYNKTSYQIIVGEYDTQKIDGALWLYACSYKEQEFIDKAHYQYFIGDTESFCHDFLEDKNYFDFDKYSKIYLGYCMKNKVIKKLDWLRGSVFDDKHFTKNKKKFCNIYTKQEDSTLTILFNTKGYYEFKFPKFIYDFLESKSNAKFSTLTKGLNYGFFGLEKELDLKTPKITQELARQIIEQEELFSVSWYERKKEHLGEYMLGIWWDKSVQKYEVFRTGERASIEHEKDFEREDEALQYLLVQNYIELYKGVKRKGINEENLKKSLQDLQYPFIWYNEPLKPVCAGIRRENNVYVSFMTDSDAQIIEYKTLVFNEESVALYALLNRTRILHNLPKQEMLGEILNMNNADDMLFKAIMTSDFELFTKALEQGANINGKVDEKQELSKYAKEDNICEEGAYYYGLALSQVLSGITLDNEKFSEEELLKENEQAFNILYAMRDLKPSDEAQEYAKDVLNDTHADWWYNAYKWADEFGYKGDFEDEEAIFAWLRENKGLRYFETLIKDLGFDLELKWE